MINIMIDFRINAGNAANRGLARTCFEVLWSKPYKKGIDANMDNDFAIKKGKRPRRINNN